MKVEHQKPRFLPYDISIPILKWDLNMAFILDWLALGGNMILIGLSYTE